MGTRFSIVINQYIWFDLIVDETDSEEFPLLEHKHSYELRRSEIVRLIRRLVKKALNDSILIKKAHFSFILI